MWTYFPHPDLQLLKTRLWAEVSCGIQPARSLKNNPSALALATMTVLWRKPCLSICPNLYPHEQDLIKRMCGLVVLHKSPSAVHTMHKYSTDWRERSTTNQGSLPVCPCARPCRLHTRSSGEYPRMRRGCPPPPLSNLLQINHVVSSLQTKKKKNKKTRIGVGGGAASPRCRQQADR